MPFASGVVYRLFLLWPAFIVWVIFLLLRVFVPEKREQLKRFAPWSTALEIGLVVALVAVEIFYQRPDPLAAILMMNWVGASKLSRWLRGPESYRDRNQLTTLNLRNS